jgi:hypothetical protein
MGSFIANNFTQTMTHSSQIKALTKGVEEIRCFAFLAGLPQKEHFGCSTGGAFLVFGSERLFLEGALGAALAGFGFETVFGIFFSLYVPYYTIQKRTGQAHALSHVKSNHKGQRISSKKLTMEKPTYFQKQRFLEGRNGIYHGRKKQNQNGIRKTVPQG